MENNNKWIEERLRSLDTAGQFTPDAARARARINERRPGRGGQWMWATAATVAGCAILMALPLTRVAAERVFERVFPAVTRVENPGLAPDFALKDASGKVVHLSDYRGKAVLLNFWATWCVPCRYEIPWFVELQEQSRDSGLIVLGVALDENGWDAVRPYIEGRKVNYPIMIADLGKLPEPYGKIEMLPMTYLIDRDGRIRGTYNSLGSIDHYRKLIAALISDSL